MPTREAWQAQLEQRLPPKAAAIDRNRAISAFYARWYLQEPWLFKWAGMAAFASDQVGVGLALADALQSPHDLLAAQGPPAAEAGLLDLGRALYADALGMLMALPLSLHDTSTRLLLLDDLALLKQGNDAIFADIGWAHAAYAAGGLSEVEANVCPDEGYLLNGFRMIDEGAHRLASDGDDRGALTLITDGNVALLRHEQMNTLPTFFERMSSQGRTIASIGAWLDFEGAASQRSLPWFSRHFGPWAVLSGARSVTRAADRWEWIEHDLLPKWAEVDRGYREGCLMHRRLVALEAQEPTMLGRAAGMLRPFYRFLSLRGAAPAVAPAY